MKRVLAAFLRMSPARVVTRAVVAVIALSARFYGRARFIALVPSAGPNSLCHWSATLKVTPNLNVGDYVWIGQHASIGAHSPIVIEDYVRISRGAVIETAGVDFTGEPPYKHISRPITLKRGVWLATNSVVLGGVTIGEYAVIGAGAVITHDVEAYTIVAAPNVRSVPFRPKPVTSEVIGR